MRTCIVTRNSAPEDHLIRFVADPDAQVVPDLRRRLPGRGVWVTATRDAVDTAQQSGGFARGLRQPVKADSDLGERVDILLQKAVLGALSMARKAGDLVTGFTKVEQAVGCGRVILLIHAADAAQDGIRRLAAAFTRLHGRDVPVPTLRIFDSAQLDLALGGTNVIHAALLDGSAGGSARHWIDRLTHYRGMATGNGQGA